MSGRSLVTERLLRQLFRGYGGVILLTNHLCLVEMTKALTVMITIEKLNRFSYVTYTGITSLAGAAAYRYGNTEFSIP